MGFDPFTRRGRQKSRECAEILSSSARLRDGQRSGENGNVPVKSEPKERPIIRMLLSVCDNGTWQHADLDWVEEKQDGAVEVIATRADGARLALEHTLIQPFVGEKFDSEAFMRAFGRIEKNTALTLPERQLVVILPVNATPKGYNWDEVGQDLLNWLLANHSAAPQEKQVSYAVPVALKAKNGPLTLPVTLQTMHLPGMAGSCLIARDKMPADLEDASKKRCGQNFLSWLLRPRTSGFCFWSGTRSVSATAKSTKRS